MPAKLNFKYRYNIDDVITNDVGYTYKILNFKIMTKMNAKHNKHRRSLYYYVYCDKCKSCFWTQSKYLRYKKCFCDKEQRGRVFIGINDIPTTDPWMVKYFLGGEQEAAQYTRGSNQAIDFKCPDCGKITNYTIGRLYAYKHLPCECNDLTSYPEKVISNILQQLNIKYKREVGRKIFPFLKKRYRYDFYLPDYNCIIETHGAQHYYKNFLGSVKERQYHDKQKKELALSNGIQHYIIIDCRKSDIDWIKENILLSSLPNLIGFSREDINWEFCNKYALKNIIKEVCFYYMRTAASSKEIGDYFGINSTTVNNHLKKGAKVGWCLYEPNFALRKPIKIIDPNHNEYLFSTIGQMYTDGKKLVDIPLNSKKISVCLDMDKSYKGHYFCHTTDPKEYFYASYGYEAVKWYEEHPEFNN